MQQPRKFSNFLFLFLVSFHKKIHELRTSNIPNLVNFFFVENLSDSFAHHHLMCRFFLAFERNCHISYMEEKYRKIFFYLITKIMYLVFFCYLKVFFWLNFLKKNNGTIKGYYIRRWTCVCIGKKVSINRSID